MNLHGLVGPLVAAVNPTLAATLKVSAGYTTAGDGTQVPAYAAPAAVQAQVQSLTWKDLQQLDGVNMNGLRRAIYLSGDVEAVIRQAVKGGDLVLFGSAAPAPLTNTTWLVAQQLEGWGDGAAPGWCKVAVTLQTD